MFGISSFAQTPFASLAGNSYALTLTEDFQATANTAEQSNYSVAQTENAIFEDLNSEGALFFESIEEVLFADTTAVGGLALLNTIDEQLGVADVETVTATNQVTVTDGVSVADTRIPYFALRETLTEATVTIGDTNSQAWAFVQTLAENIKLTFSTASTSSFMSTITEAVSAKDAPTIAAQFATLLIENTVVEQRAVLISMFVDALSEALTVDASQSAALEIVVLFGEQIRLFDEQTTQSALVQQITEAVVLSDSALIGGWQKILDGQNPSWGNVDAQQSASWGIVDTQQPSGWNLQDNSQ